MRDPLTVSNLPLEPLHVSTQPRRMLVAVALLLIVLGFGNLFYGSHRVRQTSELVSKVERNLIQPKRSWIPLADPTINTDREQQQLRRLKASHQFYQFVQSAGFWMIVLGIGTSAASLLFPIQYFKDS